MDDFDRIGQLTESSTSFTADDGTRYTWEGLTVDTATPSASGMYIFFADNSSIHLGNHTACVVTDGAKVTIYRPGEQPKIVTCQPPAAPQTSKFDINASNSTGVQIIQGYGVQHNDFRS